MVFKKKKKEKKNLSPNDTIESFITKKFSVSSQTCNQFMQNLSNKVLLFPSKTTNESLLESLLASNTPGQNNYTVA